MQIHSGMGGIVQRDTKNKGVGRHVCIPVENSKLPDNLPILTQSGLVAARIRWHEWPALHGCNDCDKGLVEKTRQPIKGHVNQPSRVGESTGAPQH